MSDKPISKPERAKIFGVVSPEIKKKLKLASIETEIDEQNIVGGCFERFFDEYLREIKEAKK